jgi:ferredoxin-thioredoxin reductase catalytic chain
MNVESRKAALRWQFQKVVDPLGYKFSPDDQLVDFLLEQEVALEQKHGIPFCPCQGLTKNRDENMMIVCPCIIFHRRHFDAMKRCWCGLYVHKDVIDPDSLPQIPLDEIGRQDDD